ncbi:MAG: cyclic nucleotide-binding domain-containing protein [Deltaproteobacteria bacterium]|nr:cyclic nucleotide-binding domain-containing protein [Deltaproteobacteria bacterium]
MDARGIEDVDLQVEKAARLRHTMLFGGGEPAALRALAAQAEIVSMAPGAEVVREGETGDALYVVTAGFLRARRRKANGHDEVLGEIQKGGFFGEFSLLEARPRNATVETMSEAQLLKLPREALLAHFETHPENEARIRATLEKRRVAAKVPFRPSQEELRARLAKLLADFGAETLSEKALDAIGKELEWVWLPAGELFLREGEPGEAVFWVLDGRLRVFTQGEAGSTLTLGEVGPGEAIGEMALLSGAPRSASASTVFDTQLVWLTRRAFDGLLADHPKTLAGFQQMMMKRLVQRARAEALSARTAVRRPVSLADCTDVMRTRDLVLRNFKITHSYHRLALDLMELMGPQDVNWLAFGAHASKTAGYSIRKEELPLYEVGEALARNATVGPLLRKSGSLLAQSFVTRAVNDVLERVSQAISDGNLRIFGDMAPVIVRFLELVRADTRYDSAKMAAFRATLRPGPSDAEGQETLGASLDAWYQAAHERDAKKRAELVLLGNARMGLHEQIRVQPDIDEALNAPLRLTFGDELGNAVEARLRLVPGPLRRQLRKGADALERPLVAAIARALRKLITQRMMRLRLPFQDVWMGADVTVAAQRGSVPRELREITNPELKALFERYAPQGPVDAAGMSAGTAAVDWSKLEDRMKFILQLFRSRQKSLELFTAPLGDEEMAAISGG